MQEHNQGENDTLTSPWDSSQVMKIRFLSVNSDCEFRMCLQKCCYLIYCDGNAYYFTHHVAGNISHHSFISTKRMPKTDWCKK